MSNPFRYFNSSPEVIRLVVMMYVRYPLSLRNVEDLEVSSRFVTFCTVLWTDHEPPWRHAASSMVLRGRKPSLMMLIALQR